MMRHGPIGVYTRSLASEAVTDEYTHAAPTLELSAKPPTMTVALSPEIATENP